MILDLLFPWFMDNVFCKGYRPEVARAAKQCHLALDHSRQNPHMCLTYECMSWQWTRRKVHWKMFFIKRRGICNHSMVRRS